MTEGPGTVESHAPQAPLKAERGRVATATDNGGGHIPTLGQAPSGMVDVAPNGHLEIGAGHLGTGAGTIARASFDQALDAIVVADDERRCIDANPAACELLGLERGELTARRVHDFTPPEALATLDSAWRGLLRTGSRHGELELLAADGSARTVEFRAAANILPGCHLLVLRDITDRVAAAERDRMRESFDLLSSVAEHVQEGLYAVDGMRRMTFVNPAAAAMLGYGSPDELLGRSVHDTIHFKRPDGSGFPAEECPLLSVYELSSSVVGEEWFVRKDGSMVPVSYTAAAIPLPEGRGLVVAFRDISEGRAADRKRRRELDALTWLGRVRDALDAGRMVVYGQPIVDLQRRAVAQHELLIRMTNGGGEVVLPGLFMPVAERYGLAPEVDRWMVEQGITLAEEIGPVDINLSAASLGDFELLAAIERALAESAADPSRVVFEITETALMTNVETASRFIHRLAELGCRFTLDDFGTGYGSFADLKSLPISFLKIDMQFVRGVTRDAGNRRVIEAIVHLAKAFGQETVAEGVEDEGSAQLLRTLGVDYGQGYLFGRPAPVSRAAS